MAPNSDSMSLDINIVSARGLTEVDLNSKTRLYVVVSITGAAQNEQRAQTHLDRDGGGNPTWNFPLKFAVDVDRLKEDLKTRLVFALKCLDGRGERDLGEVHVSVAELLRSAGDGNSMRYVAVSYPVRNLSGLTAGVLNFEYKVGGSPTSDAPAAGFATRASNAYPPQGYCYPPPPSAAGYGSYPPPPQLSNPYPPSSPSHYTPSPPYPPSSPSHYTPSPPYPPYNVGPSAALPSLPHSRAPYPPYNVGPSAAPPPPYPPYNVRPSAAAPPPYPPYNVGPSATPLPYPPYNVGPSAAPPYANPYPPHPSHVQARAPSVEQRSTPKKKKSGWGSTALEVAGAFAGGVLSGVVAPSFELPSVPAPDVSNLTAGFQIPDPTAYAPTDLSFMNTFDPQAYRDATYVDYSSLV